MRGTLIYDNSLYLSRFCTTLVQLESTQGYFVRAECSSNSFSFFIKDNPTVNFLGPRGWARNSNTCYYYDDSMLQMASDRIRQPPSQLWPYWGESCAKWKKGGCRWPPVIKAPHPHHPRVGTHTLFFPFSFLSFFFVKEEEEDNFVCWNSTTTVRFYMRVLCSYFSKPDT
jgi:hypothetical protein